MSLKSDLEKYLDEVFSSRWTTRSGQKVPESNDLRLKNDGVELKGTVLYADMDGSTNMVDSHNPRFAAEIYKTYLYSAAKIIRSEGGVITSYDGDRIMAVYIGDSKNTSAARTALKINWVTKHLINPALKRQYEKTKFQLKQVVGIDTSTLLVARTGIRGSNDLVWVGRAANYAAKLSELSSSYPSWITDDVFKVLHKDAKYGGKDNKLMWEPRVWTKMDNMRIHRSDWSWAV